MKTKRCPKCNMWCFDVDKRCWWCDALLYGTVKISPVTPDTVLLRCLKDGCPRSKFVKRSSELGKNVIEVHSYCPWHEPQGAKAYPEIYYDAKGRELDGFTWKPIQNGNECIHSKAKKRPSTRRHVRA